MRIAVILGALTLMAAFASPAKAWGPPRGPGFYVGIYAPPVYAAPGYPPPVYPAPIYPPPAVIAPRPYYVPPPAIVAPAPPGYYYPRPGVGATFWFR